MEADAVSRNPYLTKADSNMIFRAHSEYRNLKNIKNSLGGQEPPKVEKNLNFMHFTLCY